MHKRVIRESIRRSGTWGELVSNVNVVIATNVGTEHAPSQSAGAMKREDRERWDVMSESEYRKLTHEDLDQLAGEALPERAAMSLVNANLAIPVNAAVAANVLSDGSIAYADATQQTPIDQGNLTGA